MVFSALLSSGRDGDGVAPSRGLGAPAGGVGRLGASGAEAGAGTSTAQASARSEKESRSWGEAMVIFRGLAAAEGF